MLIKNLSKKIKRQANRAGIMMKTDLSARWFGLTPQPHIWQLGPIDFTEAGKGRLMGGWMGGEGEGVRAEPAKVKK